MRSYKSAMALLFAGFAACASSQTSTLQGPSGLKRTIDLKKVCQDRMQGILASQIEQDGKPVDEAMLEANSQPTSDISIRLSDASRTLSPGRRSSSSAKADLQATN